MSQLMAPAIMLPLKVESTASASLLRLEHIANDIEPLFIDGLFEDHPQLCLEKKGRTRASPVTPPSNKQQSSPSSLSLNKKLFPCVVCRKTFKSEQTRNDHNCKGRITSTEGSHGNRKGPSSPVKSCQTATDHARKAASFLQKGKIVHSARYNLLAASGNLDFVHLVIFDNACGHHCFHPTISQ